MRFAVAFFVLFSSALALADQPVGSEYPYRRVYCASSSQDVSDAINAEVARVQLRLNKPWEVYVSHISQPAVANNWFCVSILLSYR
jgi:hypothetical protein